jgi:two-component system response regulator HydG
MGAWPPGTAAVRGGRLLEETSGLRDLATGLPATFAIRLLTEAAASAWRGPVPGASRGQRGCWVVDAWLGFDPLGRWLERLVVVSGVAGERQQRRDRCLLVWLTEAARGRAGGLLPVHASCLAYLSGIDARLAPPLLVGVPVGAEREASAAALSAWVRRGGRCAALAPAPHLHWAPPAIVQRPASAGALLHAAGRWDGAAQMRAVGRAWKALASSRAVHGTVSTVVAEGRGARSMTHQELLDVSARLDDLRQDDEALVVGCRLAREHARADHVAILSRQGSSLRVVASDGDQADSGLVWPHLCAGDSPATLASTSGWHTVAQHAEDDADVWVGGRWTSVDAAAGAQDLLPVFARLVAARVPRAPAPAAGTATLEHTLIGESVVMCDVRAQIALAARAPFPVLIRGESGCGKELAARAIHALGLRRHRRCAAINCAALPDDLIESELFGHVRGAFTGAASDRAGLFDDADGGTLFLDEVGELGARAQAKLLRVLQDGEVRRVGENHARRVDVRVIAATNVSLEDAVRQGTFRADLFYRLDVVRVRMPSLRERRDDVPLLARHFWHDCTARVGSRARLDGRVVDALARYDWPGNVRQLQNTLAALAVRVPPRGRATLDDLPPEVRLVTEPSSGGRTGLEAARREFEATYVRNALSRAGGRPTMAARDLGMTRQGLSKLVRRLGLDEPGASSRLP